MMFKNVFVTPFSKGQRSPLVASGASILHSMLMKCNIVAKGANTHIFKHEVSYQDIYDKLKKTTNNLVLGGDHSIAHSSVFASMNNVERPEDLVVIWIDAHADINTHHSSITKNLHGMPLSGIIGLENPWIKLSKKIKDYEVDDRYSSHNNVFLPTQNLLYLGVRDIDEAEKQVIKKFDIFTTHDYRKILKKVNQMIEKNPFLQIHISFDVDSLDPVIFDSAITLAKNGLFVHEIVNLFNHLPHDRIKTLDIVEFNPSFGKYKQSFNTLDKIFSSI